LVYVGLSKVKKLKSGDCTYSFQLLSIEELKGESKELYRLKFRRYRVIYQKEKKDVEFRIIFKESY